MSCKCNKSCCKRNLGCFKSGTPTAGTSLIIPISVCVDKLKQGDRIEFFIPCCFDYPKCISNVHLLINNTVSLTLLKYGTVKSDQIRNRTKYCVVVGTEFSTATVLNDLPCSKFPFEDISLVSSVAAISEPVAKTAKTIKEVTK